MGDPRALVGRDRELGLLAAALAEVGTGGAVVSVSGQPGVGKTATVRAFAAEAGAGGATVLWGSCFEGTSQAPYGPWSSALAPLGPIAEPADELKAPESRLRFFTAVHRALVAASDRAPVVVVVDDLHWASRDSVELFGYVAERVEGSPVLLIGTYRDPDPALERTKSLAPLLAGLVRLPGYRRVVLRGLPEADVARYVAEAFGGDVPAAVVRAVHEQTGGNPFYVREVVQALVEERKLVRRDGRWLSDFSLSELAIPETVRDAVRGRVAGLSADTVALLQAASVFAGGLDLATVGDVANLDEGAALDAVDEALASGLLVTTGRAEGPYAFSHAIVRHALADSVNPDRAARLHRRAAEALERLRPGDRAGIAEQYSLSRSLAGAERGVEHCLAAADAAASQHAHRQAVRLLELALELAPPPDADARLRILERLAVAQAEALDFDAAPATTLQVVERVAPARAAQLIVRVAEALREGSPASAYEPLVRRGLALMVEGHDAPWARLVTTLEPVETVGTGPLRVGRWVGYPPEAVAALQATGLEEDEARAIEPFRPRSVDETAAFLERSRRWRSPRARMRALDLAGRDFSLRHGLLLDAVDCYRELLELGERTGSVPAKAEACGQLALCLALVGDQAAAQDHLARSVALARDLWPGHRLHLLGTISSSTVAGYFLGEADWDDLAGRLTTWVRSPAAARAPFADVFAALAALCCAFAGRRDDAHRLLEELAAVLHGMAPQDHAVAGSLWFGASAAWEAGDAEVAGPLAELIGRHLDAGGPPGPAPLEHAAGRLAALRGRDDDAVARFARGRAATYRSGTEGVRALVDFDDATVRGDDAAKAAAASSFARLGMAGWAARAGERRSPGRPAGLTPREVEVLCLLAAGRTSHEIATELVVSIATVNRHVANIYRKIAVRNRSEATSFAIARGLVDA